MSIIRSFFVVFMLLNSIQIWGHGSDSTKVEALSEEISSYMKTFADFMINSKPEDYIKMVKKNVPKFKNAFSELETITNDTTGRPIYFLGELAYTIAYERCNEIDSAFIHANNTFELFKRHTEIAILDDSTKNLNSMIPSIYGGDGVLSIIREYYIIKGEYSKATNISREMINACKKHSFNGEIAGILNSEADAYELIGDYQASIKKRCEAYDYKSANGIKNGNPTYAQIYYGITETYQEYIKTSKFSSKEDYANSFGKVDKIFLHDFLSQNQLLNLVEKAKEENDTTFLHYAVDSFSRLLVELKQFDEIDLDKYEVDLKELYGNIYKEESFEYIEMLDGLCDIYEAYKRSISENYKIKRVENKIDKLQDEMYSGWSRQLEYEPLEVMIERYNCAKEGSKVWLKYRGKLKSWVFYNIKLGTFKKITEREPYINTAKDILYVIENVLHEECRATFSALAYRLLIEGSKESFALADKLAKKALHLSTEKSDTIGMIEANQLLFSIYKYTRNYSGNQDEAKDYLMRAFSLIMNFQTHSLNKAKILRDLSWCFKQYNRGVAVKLLSKSIKEKEIIKEPIDDSDYLMKVEFCGTYFLNEDKDLLNRIIHIADKIDTTYAVQRASEHLGAYYACFTDHIDNALYYYKRASALANVLDDSVSLSNDLREIGIVYSIKGEYQIALNYLAQAEEIMPNLKRWEVLLLMAHMKNDSIVEERLPIVYNKLKAVLKKDLIFTNSKERENLACLMLYPVLRSMAYYFPKNRVCADYAYNSTLLFKGLLQNTERKITEQIIKTLDNSMKERYNTSQKVNIMLQNDEPRMYNNDEELMMRVESANIENTIMSMLPSKKINSDIDISWEDVQKRLGKKDIAIEFVEVSKLEALDQSPFLYGALILRRSFKHPFFVELELKDNMDRLIETVIEYFNIGSRVSRSRWSSVSKQLYKVIWGELEKFISVGDNIYFSAAGMIHQAPIEVLLDEDGFRANEKYRIYRLSSTRELCKRKKHRIESVTLYGGLEYNNEGDAQTVDTLSSFRPFSDSLSRAGWSYLPSTALEVEKIASHLDSVGIKTVKWEGNEGTEKSFRNLSGASSSILHIATHGFYFQNKETQSLTFFHQNINPNYISPMKRTGIMMSGGQDAWLGAKSIKQEEDGVLLAEEIASLDLSKTDLVVLSACQTGLGDMDTGGEGVFGIQRAFKLAGVNSLLMTLGRVDDKATQLFMDYFYKNIAEGKSKYDSFNIAQEYIRNYVYEFNGFKMDYSNPKYWAPFILLDAIN